MNQVVALRVLEKHGHRVLVAGNGREALLALEKTAFQGFDIVLMDVQMPVMDGLEATAAIRRQEEGTGRHIPIVAMTAHAMKGDKERCFEAGMDEYLSKPIRAQELFDILENFAGVPATAEDSAPMAVWPDDLLDRRSILTAFEGDTDLLRDVVRLFLEDFPHRLAEIREALSRNDAAALARAAHNIKGTICNFAAPAPFQAARTLEEIGRSGDLRGAAESLKHLEDQLECLQLALAEFAKEYAA